MFLVFCMPGWLQNIQLFIDSHRFCMLQRGNVMRNSLFFSSISYFALLLMNIPMSRKQAAELTLPLLLQIASN